MSNKPARAPVNPLCTNDHPEDTIAAAKGVVSFLKDAIPNQLAEDPSKDAADGAMWCLMMVEDALGHAQEQLRRMS